MREIESWITDAGVRLGITIEKLPTEESKSITKSIEQKYVEGSPRVWWLGLRTPYVYYSVNSVSISQILPRVLGKVHFIPEEDDGLPLSVFMINAGDLEPLIGDCTFFEYYVADIESQWIIAETEHDVFLVAFESESLLRIAPGGHIWQPDSGPGL